ncbi:MAG TPA: glycosyltransferase family 39 protein [Candidatus Moranbacteria bacterium]|nr:glycosyltransferase family 39 protein [Candidatus Moranbacteria bacterium]HSA08504.1 glycosyltransferase family 39 protein [Candidatus Moranbacteria bacterium]
MKNFQSLAFWKKPSVILALILAAFFLKGVFLATLYPVFGGQDEARHYNTIQYLNEPEDSVSENAKNIRANDISKRDKDNFDTYNFSEEIQKTATAANVDILRDDIYNTQVFSESFKGQNEEAINSSGWKPYNYYSNPDIASISLYHKIAVQIEKIFSEQSILVRFYLIRIFSVLLGTAAILLAYLIAKTIGFSAKHSLLLTAIIAFQPKFSMYFTNINYDILLIPLFFLFTFAGVYILKKGLNWKGVLLLIFSTASAIETKATGYILLVIAALLVAYILYEKVKTQKEFFRYGIYGACALVFLSVAYFIYAHFLKTGLAFGKILASIWDYISRTITFGKFVMPSETYWGTLSWTNNFIINNTTKFILIIEILALIGLLLLFFSKKLFRNYPNFLPAKKYILFLILMVVFLELGIRLADWAVFNKIGGMKYSLGTPGRYFLPNLVAHIILIFTGLGALFEAIFSRGGSTPKGLRYFEKSLIVGLILMMTFMMYIIFDVIILRYYL